MLKETTGVFDGALTHDFNVNVLLKMAITLYNPFELKTIFLINGLVIEGGLKAYILFIETEVKYICEIIKRVYYCI